MELPRAIQYDDQPNRLMLFAAEQRQQQEMLMQRAVSEQKKLLADLDKYKADVIGSTSKDIIESSKDIAPEIANGIVMGAIRDMTKMVRGVNTHTDIRTAATEHLASASQEMNKYRQYQKQVEDVSKAMGDMGANPEAIKKHLLGMRFSIGRDGTPVPVSSDRLPNPVEIAGQLFLKDPNKFADAQKLSSSLIETFGKVKPGQYSADQKKDVSTTKMIGLSNEIKSYPWTKVVEVKAANGLTGYRTKIDTEKIGGFDALTEDAFKWFDTLPPIQRTQVKLGARQIVDKLNREFVGDAAALITEDNVNEFVKKGAINPYDPEVIRKFERIYAADFVKSQSPNTDKDGYLTDGKFGTTVDLSNPPKNTTVINNNGGQGQNYIDSYKTIEAHSKKELKMKDAAGNIVMGAPVNTLESLERDLVISQARQDTGDSELTAADIYLTQKDGKTVIMKTPAYIQKQKQKAEAEGGTGVVIDNNPMIGPLSKVGVNIDANSDLGQKAKGAAAAGSNTKPTKTISKAEFIKMSIADRQKFIKEGGTYK